MEPPDNTEEDNCYKSYICIKMFTNMFIQFRSDVDVRSLDGAEHQLGHALAFLVDQVGLEQSLASSEPFSANLT